MTPNKTIRIPWKPQPRQLVALQAAGLSFPFDSSKSRPAIADVIGYGGSAGGGKTDTLLAIGLVAAMAYPGIRIGYFRRQFPQLEGLGGAIDRSYAIYGQVGKYNQQKHRWTFFTGAQLQFCHAQNPKDVYNYQSQQFDILLIDEATQFTQEMIDYLITRNRKTIENQMFKPFCAMATNPGNIGHGMFLERFVKATTKDADGNETLIEAETVFPFRYETGVIRYHIFIPSKLDDNQKLVQRDPTYKDRLATNEMNRKMLLEGDWDVFQGQAFSECRRDKHLIDPYELRPGLRLFGAYDHGFDHPFSFGVFAVDEDGNVDLVRYVSDRLLRPNQIVDRISKVIDLSLLDYITAGHDLWGTQRDGGPKIVEQFLATEPFKKANIPIVKAKIDRIQGAQQVRDFLAWKETMTSPSGNLVDGSPRFRIFKTCAPVYDTIARMIFDPDKPGDVLKVNADENGKGGDDDYDMARYALMSRPKPLPQIKNKYPEESGMAILERHWEKKRLEKELGNWR